jgi:hypothetical protein
MLYHPLTCVITLCHAFSTFIMCYHPVSCFIILYHPLSSCTILYHPLSPVRILYHPLSCFIILYHPLWKCLEMYWTDRKSEKIWEHEPLDSSRLWEKHFATSPPFSFKSCFCDLSPLGFPNVRGAWDKLFSQCRWRAKAHQQARMPAPANVSGTVIYH